MATDDADLAALALIDRYGGGARTVAVDGRILVEVWIAPADDVDVWQIGQLLAAWGISGEVTIEREDPSWQTATREFHRPVEISGRLRVRPPWEAPRRGLLDVVIDPGMAFGSGQHATTQSCLEALCALPPSEVLDVGCGSGILAIAAAKLGFEPVRAVDVAPESVAATLRNASENGVSVDARQVVAGVDSLGGTPLVLANVTATVLCELAERPPEPLPARAVLSGMRDFELDAVHDRWARLGLGPERVLDIDGWCTSVLAR